MAGKSEDMLASLFFCWKCGCLVDIIVTVWTGEGVWYGEGVGYGKFGGWIGGGG